jgi:hypothetical protein
MEYKFEVTEQEANVILKALTELPFKESATIINKLHKQATEQQSEKGA